MNFLIKVTFHVQAHVLILDGEFVAVRATLVNRTIRKLSNLICLIYQIIFVELNRNRHAIDVIHKTDPLRQIDLRRQYRLISIPVQLICIKFRYQTRL